MPTKNPTKFLLFGLIASTILHAGNTTALADAPVVPVASVSPWYLGAGIGGFALVTQTNRERLSSKSASLILGYTLTPYLAIEGRYTHAIGSLHYDAGKTPSPSRTLTDSTYTDTDLLLKLSYPIGRFSPYLLAGYGRSTITHIVGSNRTESSLRYGAGLSYQAAEHLHLFADYLRAYHGKGFDGRSIDENVHLDRLTVGVTYHF